MLQVPEREVPPVAAAKRDELVAMLEQQIVTGQLAPGQLLPSEPELVAQTGYSRGTVREAYAELAGRGLIEVSQGQRRWVPDRVRLDIHVTRTADRAVGGQQATLGADSWRGDVEALGYKAGETLAVLSAQSGDLGLAGRLALDPGDQVVIRQLMRSAGDRPHNWDRWVFPRWLAAGTKLAAPDDIPEGSIPYLSGLGQAPGRYRVEMEWRMPASDETRLLAIPRGVPVAVLYRTGYGPAGRPVFCEVTVWPGDR